jgi:ABC-type uncharacterized transport system permease subunit
MDRAHSRESSNAIAPLKSDETAVTAIAQLLPFSFLAPSTAAMRGENTMQSALMVGLAVSIVLGMWVIWKLTP